MTPNDVDNDVKDPISALASPTATRSIVQMIPCFMRTSQRCASLAQPSSAAQPYSAYLSLQLLVSEECIQCCLDLAELPCGESSDGFAVFVEDEDPGKVP